MDARTAVQLLSRVTYKPGWEFDITIDEKRHESAIRVNVMYPAPNSDAAMGPDYTVDVVGGARARFILMAGVFHSPEHLYRGLLDKILMIEQHEAREFFGVASSIMADKPFHPHTIAGMSNWLNVTDDWHSRVAADIQFGSA